MKRSDFRDRLNAIPLRWQLTIAMMLLVMITLVAINLAASTVVSNVLVSRVDSQLINTARDQVRRGGQIEFPSQPSGGGFRDSPALLSGFFAMVVDANGEGESFRRLPEGSSQQGPRLPPLDATNARKLANSPFTVRSVDGVGEWRVIVTPLPNGFSYVTAVGLSDVKATLGRFMTPLILLSVLTLLLVGALGFAVVRARLKALREVEATAARIAKGDLSQRVPEHDPRTEIGSLALAINTMLVMIERYFAQQKQAEAAARESENRMRRFVADASHELRTPLTSIRGYAELMQQTGLTKQSGSAGVAVGRIQTEAGRMGALVEDLLLLARLDQDNGKQSDEVDLVELASDVAADAPVIGSGHIFELAVASEPVVVEGDRDQLRRVISNLVTNAFHHTPEGSSVLLKVTATGNDAVIEVSDDGPGISEADRSRVFDRFFRADESRSRRSGGTGLGLSIVKKIVDSHHGSIEVTSAQDTGVIFKISIPLCGEKVV